VSDVVQSTTGRIDTSRLEAFSDGVIAIIITIMVLEIHRPEEPTLDAVRPLIPTLLAYLLSFVFVGNYWNNHHHLFKAAKAIDGRVMWANLHLLFWLSLIPVATGWVGDLHDHAWPAALYGVLGLICGIAYSILLRSIIQANPHTRIRAVVGTDRKGIISLALYSLGALLAFVDPWIGYGAYALVSVIWFIPDRRLSQLLGQPEQA